MESPPGPGRLVRFGLFELDLGTGELRRGGVKIRLQQQPFRVLAILLEKPGELVSREELRHRLWPDDVFVDFEHGLNKAVGKIRDALGDLADSPRYVETLAKRGYRFLGTVEIAEHHAAPPPPRVFPAMLLAWGDRSSALAEGEAIIGRDPAAKILVDSATVSRRHARILVRSGSAFLEDLGSKNGTFVNGQRLDRFTLLADGDEIRIGPARLVFHTVSPPEATVTQSGT